MTTAAVPPGTAQPKRLVVRAAVAGLDFEFSIALASEGTEPEAMLDVSAVDGVPDTYLLRIRAARRDGLAFKLDHFAIRWEVPAVDMHGYYSPPPSPDEMVKLPYWRLQKKVGANTGLPFVMLFHRGGENRAAFGLVDQLTETALDSELSEASRSYHFHWHKPIGAAGWLVDEWVETLFVSLAREPWPVVLRAYAAMVESEWPQPRLPVPESAYDPVFCTWTAIHHAVSQDWILRNARLAADLGFGTWLTDDGWFTDKATFGNYAHAGDWQPCQPKFPDFAGHVRAVQALGLRYILWVAPFMVGKATEAAQRYAHLLSEPIDELDFSNLSPRHPETAELVTDLLARLMQEYALDGLKIDFIDAIGLEPQRDRGPGDQSVGEAFYHIMVQATNRLLELKPDVLIEFRNTYANLASRRFANLYRSSDVPLNFAMNRWQAVMLRLLAPDRAVHLDPALWHPADSDESVAVHLINLICSVPTVSIELDRYPQSHLDLIRNWIGFYRAHRQTIIHGQFVPALPLGHIPLIHFNGAHERIIAVYEDIALAFEAGPLTLWVLNASTRPFVELLPDGLRGRFTVGTRDKFGRRLSQETLSFPRPRLPVEVGGSLEIRPA